MSQHDLARRLDAAMANAGMTQAALGGALGITQASVGQIKSGRMRGDAHWPKIAEILGCSEDWLRLGTGTPPAWAATAAENPAEQAEIAALRDTIRRQAAEIADLQIQVAATRRVRDR